MSPSAPLCISIALLCEFICEANRSATRVLPVDKLCALKQISCLQPCKSHMPTSMCIPSKHVQADLTTHVCLCRLMARKTFCTLRKLSLICYVMLLGCNAKSFAFCCTTCQVVTAAATAREQAAIVPFRLQCALVIHNVQQAANAEHFWYECTKDSGTTVIASIMLWVAACRACLPGCLHVT